MLVVCECGYEWDTSSTKVFVSCPSCLNKTKVRKEKNPGD